MPAETKDDDDAPVKQRLRIVSVMDFVSGVVDNADRTPISIMLLGHLGELEQPMAVTIEDTQSLVVKCLESLASHGDDFAELLLDKCFTDDDDDDGNDDNHDVAVRPD